MELIAQLLLESRTGAQCLVEDERLCKWAISGGSATVGTRANNGYEFITLFKTLKLGPTKGFAKRQDAIILGI